MSIKPMEVPTLRLVELLNQHINKKPVTYKILKEILETPFAGKTVVLSHHAPPKCSSMPFVK